MARNRNDRNDSTSMKPKNRVMCPDSMKQKMLFESERKANDFIKWNGGEIDTHGGVLRAYYCPACCGWHITHKEHNKAYDNRTERLITAFNRVSKPNKKIDRLIHSFDYEADARCVFADLPPEIQDTESKARLRRYLTDYFYEKDINDDNGCLRTAIYKIWESRR